MKNNHSQRGSNHVPSLIEEKKTLQKGSADNNRAGIINVLDLMRVKNDFQSKLALAVAMEHSC